MHLFRVHWVAAYFAALSLWPISASLSAGAGLPEALLGLLAPLPVAAPTIALLLAAAWGGARTTSYYVTDRRVILQIGIGLTKIVNVPLRQVAHAGFREHGDGSMDIALTLRPPGRIAYLALWPHARGWRVSHLQPMLRGLPDGAAAAEVLTDALMAAALRPRWRAPSGPRRCMAETAQGIRVPRPALWGAGLIAFTFAAILVARDTGLGTFEAPAVRAAESRELVFRAAPGGMEVLDAADRPLARLVVEGDSFVMTAVRVLAAQRSDDPVASGYRIRVVRGPDGSLGLVDPETERALPLAGFGQDNARAFSRWLSDPAG